MLRAISGEEHDVASYSATAFDDVSAFSVTAFDFIVVPSFNPAYSEGAFGRNTAFWDKAFSFGLVPPTPPTPGRQRGGLLYDSGREYWERERLRELRDAEDVEIVKVLTEFLSRQ